MVFIHRHSSNLRLNLSICRSYSALWVLKYFVLHPVNWVSADTLHVPLEPLRGWPETFLPPEKSHTKCFASLRQIVKGCLHLLSYLIHEISLMFDSYVATNTSIKRAATCPHCTFPRNFIHDSHLLHIRVFPHQHWQQECSELPSPFSPHPYRKRLHNASTINWVMNMTKLCIFDWGRYFYQSSVSKYMQASKKPPLMWIHQDIVEKWPV